MPQERGKGSPAPGSAWRDSGPTRHPKEDIDRMDELALKAREGTLTDEEKMEINAYV